MWAVNHLLCMNRKEVFSIARNFREKNRDLQNDKRPPLYYTSSNTHLKI